MQASDPIEALVTLVAANAAVLALVGARVYGEELPAEATSGDQPQPSVVITGAGGIPAAVSAEMEVERMRVDVFTYASTPYAASQLAQTVYSALRSIKRERVGSTLIHWVRPAGGLIGQRDPDTRWPRVFKSYEVFVSEKEAS